MRTEIRLDGSESDLTNENGKKSENIKETACLIFQNTTL